MNVEELERLALSTHDGVLEVVDDIWYTSKAKYEQYLGVNFKKRVKELRAHYPKGPLLMADLGCHSDRVVKELNRLKHVEAFGIDIDPVHCRKHGSPKSRIIVADLNDMPHIPDDTFHYLISFNCLSYTDIARSFPEIYRILAAEGIADVDYEFWETQVEEFEALEIADLITVVGGITGFRGNMQEFLHYIAEAEKGRDIDGIRDSAINRFEIRKRLYSFFLFTSPPNFSWISF